MKAVNLSEKFSQIDDYWNPRVVGELNGQQVRLVKVFGEFPFHKHEHEDEMFFVVKGKLKIEFEDRTENVNENEFLIVPANVLHRPVAEKEVEIMLFVTKENVNTGNIENHQWKRDTKSLKKI
ncbi:MAG: cupin domain-containing protein [Bacteroidetes bacterium HGW-Bacteroidetes-17]|jgi:mannose-6-phosphate isomerase-like protein (cupin superfamily)|nr:MAG: cupin domain-containing protein [Bacteroidetes bacterium HGW-Bacteroidetes-17]